MRRTPRKLARPLPPTRCLVTPIELSEIIMDSRPVRAGTALASALLFVLALNACSSDTAARNSVSSAASTKKPVSTAIDLGTAVYHAIAMGAVGGVSGVLSRMDSSGESAPPSRSSRDSIEPGCEQPQALSRAIAKGRVANAVVWIAGLTTGKALPEEKRADLESIDCLVDPRVQAIIVGTTVNVINDDKVLHRLVFIRDGAHDTLAAMPFFNEGEVVASERLARVPGLVEVTCTFHRSTRGYLAVFAHPYFAVTDSLGRFTIDSLPPGSYTLHIWREGTLHPAEQQVVVTAGGVARADVMLR